MHPRATDPRARARLDPVDHHARPGRRAAAGAPSPRPRARCPSSLSVHQPRSRRLGSRPSKPSSPKRTKAPFSIRPTTSPSNAGGRRSASAPALEQEGEADVVGGALDLHRLALGRRGGDARLVELVRRAQGGVVDAEALEQRAVRDHVRVAADRRGEVAVARAAEPRVAEVLRRVVGLLERAQHEHAEARAPAGSRATMRDASADQVGGLLGRHVLRHRRRRDVEARELLGTGTPTAVGSGRSWTR